MAEEALAKQMKKKLQADMLLKRGCTRKYTWQLEWVKDACKREKESPLGTGLGFEVGYEEELGSEVYMAGGLSSKDSLDCRLYKALGPASPHPTAQHTLQTELKPTIQPKLSGTSRSVTWGPVPRLGTQVLIKGPF